MIIKDKKIAGEFLAEGKYQVTGWSLETTGYRLINEICQIAAYNATSNFAQYVMPYSTVNFHVQRRHNIRIIASNRCRIMKNSRTNEVLKTKTEFSTLNDFLTWLELNKEDSADGIVLIHHEIAQLFPIMLLNALHHHNLYERFAKVVKGFANTHLLARSECAQSLERHSLKLVSRTLFGSQEQANNAADRARLCYRVMQHLVHDGLRKMHLEIGPENVAQYRSELLRVYASTVGDMNRDLHELKLLLEKQKPFRPMFKDMMSANWLHRQNANKYRKLLVKSGMNFEKLRDAWNHGKKSGVTAALEQVTGIEEKELDELIQIVVCFFDPEKRPAFPKLTRESHSRSV